MTTETTTKTQTIRKIVGTVVAISGEKTVSVQIDNLVKHEQYGKFIRKSTKLAVHDENGQAKVGDKVEIVADKPRSKRKAHRLLRVVVRSAE